MDAIFFVLRTGCQWNALNATGICSSSSAYRRVQEWCDAGVFERFWQNGLLAGEYLDGIDWSWLSMDDYMTKSPLAGTKKTVRNSTDRKKKVENYEAMLHFACAIIVWNKILLG